MTVTAPSRRIARVRRRAKQPAPTVMPETRIQFVAVSGSRLSDKDAAAVGPILHRMAPDELLSDEAVFEAAKSPRSPLHKHFTWDVQVAAKKQWLREARNLISAIAFVIADGTETDPPPVRYFVNLPMRNGDGETENYYCILPLVHRNPDLEEEMLRIAARELAAFRERYGKLKRLDEIVAWSLLDALLNELS